MGNLNAFDLKVLLAFDAMMQEKHVTRAANRLGVSQPALSHTLQRLRLALGDELFVRGPEGMSPTPRAHALQDPIRRALRDLQAALTPNSFNPATATRRFTVALNNRAAMTLAAPLTAAAAQAAPDVTLDLRPSGTLRVDDLLDRAEIDAAIVGEGRVHGDRFGAATLSNDGFAVLARRDHPLFRQPVTFARLATTHHIELSSTQEETGFLDEILAREGLPPRHIQSRVPLLSIGPVLAAGDAITVTAGPIATALAATHALACADLPADPDVPVIPTILVWARRLEADAGSAWLRGIILAAARTPPDTISDR